MIKVRDIVSYFNSNKGHVIAGGADIELQVYKSEALQANITKSGKVLLKLEERKEREYSIFLASEEVPSDISYAKACVLTENDSILKLYDTFKEHSKVEDALMAFLLLKNQ